MAASMSGLPVVSVIYHTAAKLAEKLVTMEAAWPTQMRTTTASHWAASGRPVALTSGS